MSLLRLKSKEPLKAVSVKSLERLVVYEPIKARGSEPVKATVLKGYIFSFAFQLGQLFHCQRSCSSSVPPTSGEHLIVQGWYILVLSSNGIQK